ncbi:unnamed protein product, partial [Chrysoparadoxa australica]
MCPVCYLLSSTMDAVQTQLDDLTTALNTFWLVFGAILVFFMQTGFAMLEVGCVSIRNTKNILIKNIGDAALGAIFWWLLGFGVAFGEDAGGGFIGGSNFALKGSFFEPEPGVFDGYAYGSWLFQWAFAATAATIVSGAVAERLAFGAYVIYSIVLTSFIYPVVVHWGWAVDGWASAFNTNTTDDLLFGCGVIDFAGSVVVHYTGGLAALIACFVLGPRIGRFIDGVPHELPQQSAVLQTLGVLILWVGWYGFNGVSTLYITGAGVAAKVCVTTTIGAASGSLAAVLLTKAFVGHWDAAAANNGILAGLVAITAGCSVVEPEGAFIIGIIGGIVFYFASELLLSVEIDDVVDAIPVHMFNGAWGVFAASLFATKDNYSSAYYAEYDDGSSRVDRCAGAFYGGSGQAVAAAVCFILAVTAWVGFTGALLFYGIQYTIGMRVSKEVEEVGMDDSKHGGQTYPELR